MTSRWLPSLRLLLAMLTLFCATAVAQNRAGGEVSGTLTIGEGARAQKIELKHVYASVAHQYGGPDKPLFLVFTDKPLPTDPVERVNYLSVMTQAGQLTVLRVEIYRKEVRGSYAMCGSCQTSSSGEGNKAYYNNGEEREMTEEDDEQEFDLKTLDGQTISGTVHSTVIYDSSALQDLRMHDGSRGDSEESPAQKSKPKQAYQYRVTFKAAIRNEPEMARRLPEGGGEPGKAYLAFHDGVVAANATEIKRLLSASAQKSFSGSAAQVARLKSLVEPFKLVGSSIISTTGKYAFLHLQDIPYELPPGTRKSLDEPKPDSLVPVYNDPLTSIPMPPPPPAPAAPPPPPPPPPGAVKSARPKSPRGGIPGGVPGGIHAAFPRYPVNSEARMVSEGGLWKVEWFFLDHDTTNLLSQLDTYKTSTERYTEIMKAEEEERRKEEEESSKIENASPLPAGGGEPGKAYLGFCQAERAGNKQQLVKYLTGAQFDLYNNPGLTIKRGAFIWKESSALDYANLEIVSGVASEEKAVLEVQAIRLGYRTTGKVLMILEEGQWKVDNESWQTDTSKKVR